MDACMHACMQRGWMQGEEGKGMQRGKNKSMIFFGKSFFFLTWYAVVRVVLGDG